MLENLCLFLNSSEVGFGSILRRGFICTVREHYKRQSKDYSPIMNKSGLNKDDFYVYSEGEIR